jgi:hypothetical protein
MVAALRGDRQSPTTRRTSTGVLVAHSGTLPPWRTRATRRCSHTTPSPKGLALLRRDAPHSIACRLKHAGRQSCTGLDYLKRGAGADGGRHEGRRRWRNKPTLHKQDHRRLNERRGGPVLLLYILLLFMSGWVGERKGKKINMPRPLFLPPYSRSDAGGSAASCCISPDLAALCSAAFCCKSLTATTEECDILMT